MPEERRPVGRSVLFIGHAAEPNDVANSVLSRFGFQPAELVQSLATAVTRLREKHFDLVVLSLEGLGPVELTLVEREIRQSSSLIIGTASASHPDLLLSALRAGIHEFVAAPIEAKSFGVAVDRLVRRMSSPTALAGTTIAIYSAKGGLGTTTIAVNLAAAIAKSQPAKRVALADYVVVGGDVRVMLDLKPAYDIGDLVMKVDRIDGDLLYSLLSQGPSGVWTLPSSDKPEVLDLIDANAAATIISQLRGYFGYVVVDTEHYLSERTLAALDAADRIVLVTQLSVTALRSTQRSLQLFERLGYAREKVSVIVNRTDADSALSVRDAESVLGRPILWRLPNDFSDCSEATTKGVPVLEFAPDSPLSRSFLNLAAKLVGTGTETGTADMMAAVTATGPAPASPTGNGHDNSSSNGNSADANSRIGRMFRLGRR